MKDLEPGQFRCTRCGHEWEEPVAPASCPRCYHEYVVWVNAEGWHERNDCGRQAPKD